MTGPLTSEALAADQLAKLTEENARLREELARQTAKARVAICHDESGFQTVFAAPDVEVISVCEFTPDDRLYRLQTAAIPEGLLDGPIGHMGDGSPAEARAIRTARDMSGRRRFDFVGDEE